MVGALNGLMSITGTVAEQGLDSPAEVLGFARACRREADAAQANLLLAAVTWAEQHPPESIGLEATWRAGGGAETGIPLAGEGAPLVAEFCIAELAAALGTSSDSGRTLIASALELKYRLPRLWARVQSGDLPAWRARRVATPPCPCLGRRPGSWTTRSPGSPTGSGFAALERLVAVAVARFMPQKAAVDASNAAERRHVTFHHDQVSFAGTTFVEGELDLADALDLDAALSRGAHELAALGSTESLDVRRSIAAGDLARRQLALDLHSDHDLDESIAAWSAGAGGRSVKPTSGGALRAPLRDRPDRPPGPCLELARVENRRRGVTADQVRAWCANPDTTVTVRPVVDLNEHTHVEAYEVPDRLREQTILTNLHCVFPHCTRSARTCDADHVIAHDAGGATCSGNLAALCRRHHRLKTHTPWTYTVLEPGSFLWTSPHGHTYLRDHTGTTDLTPQPPHPYGATDPDPPDQ